MLQNQNEQPIALFSHTMTFPGVPLENLVSSISLLLSAYGVSHQLPVSPTFTSEGLTSGDNNRDQRFVTEYMQFKLMLEDLSRQYTTVQCTAQSNGASVYLRFSCY
ncbi:hypothetical protein N1M2_31 [Klebsiella phage N1M2]|uniref:Uncharacterized protein n=1 Tax=Klebsiella phage N1M2 TaxID=2664939 RepID=A0A6B7ZF74_9CAUD|nr:hypothetical protein PQB72_gp031 [Klebsiella phage N1M2]QGH71894.1 hypothetical protein N1M2_31 [Klebsiella phage N1M2]